MLTGDASRKRDSQSHDNENGSDAFHPITLN